MIGDIRIWVKKDSPAEGKYLLIWTPEEKWKEEIVLNGYKRIRIGDGEQFWQIRNTDMEYPPVFELERLMDVSRELKPKEGVRLSRSHPEKIDGQDAECIKRESNSGYAASTCFDPKSGALLTNVQGKSKYESPLSFRSEEYSQFQQWAGKIYPRTMRGFDGKQLLFEVQLEEIKTLPDLSPDFFATAQGFGRVGRLHRGGDVEAQRAGAACVSRIRKGPWNRRGTVVLYGVIEADGTVSSLRPVYPTGSDLDQAATSAVSRWRYVRGDACPGAAGRTETLIDVIFELRHH